MKIVVAARCRNDERHVERFLRGYNFADRIVVSDGGSTDRSVELLSRSDKVQLLHFDKTETIGDVTWNPDAPHMNFVLDVAKSHNPDWLIFDDIDDVPNKTLREDAKEALEMCDRPQVNAFRLYLWGDDQYFPYMNRGFAHGYESLWAWQPDRIDIRADENLRHGTLVGMMDDPVQLRIPYCLLHKSWSPETIDAKLHRYNTVGLPMQHPLEFAGQPEPLPEWAHE